MEFSGLIALVMVIGGIVGMIIQEMAKEKKQKEAHEKVMELMKEGHDAEVCPKCKGRGTYFGASFSGRCSECGGIGYTYKLNKEKLRKKDEKK